MFPKDKEIKAVIDLLKHESSDHLTVLDYLYRLLDKGLRNEINLDKKYLQMGFLSVALKIFENEKEDDEKIINILVVIINKMNNKYFEIDKTYLYKSVDAINSLYNFMIDYKESNVSDEASKTIVAIAKKHSTDVVNNNNIKNCYKEIFPSNHDYSDKKKTDIYILFEELIKEGIIKKGEEGSEIIEEILYIAEYSYKKKDIINIKDEELIKEINNYIIIAKEKGFEGNIHKNKNDIIAEDLFYEWIKFLKEENNSSDNIIKAIIKEEEEENIKKFCENISVYYFDIQMLFLDRLYRILHFMNKYLDEFKLFKSRKNGIFLYLYFPLLFKIYHFEEIFPKFLLEMQARYNFVTQYYSFIILLYDDVMERMIKEEKKEMEINEEIIIICMFLWSVIKKEEKKEKEIECLVNSTVKIFEWLGRTEEAEEGKINEKEKESLKRKVSGTENLNERLNIKESFFCKLLDIITKNLFRCPCLDAFKIKKDGRIGKILFEIMKNQIKNERYLIQKGNKRKIIEYIIFSYHEFYDTSDVLNVSSNSFPFSHYTIICIINTITKISDSEYKLLIKKDTSVDILELLNNYIDVMYIIKVSDIKKEIEREIRFKWNNNMITLLKNKSSFSWYDFHNIHFSSSSNSFDLSLLDYDGNNVIKRMVYLYFSHNDRNNNNNFTDKNDSEKKCKDSKEIIKTIPFLVNDYYRKTFFDSFVIPLTSKFNYTLFVFYNLSLKSKEGYSVLSIIVKILSGEIVEEIKKKEGINAIKERRRYERERMEEVIDKMLCHLNCLMEYTLKDRNKIHIGEYRDEESYKGREEEMKKDKEYVIDMIEEEDLKQCFILYLKRMKKNRINKFVLSNLSRYSNKSLYYLLCK